MSTAFFVVLLFCAFVIGQAFGSYKLRYFFRIFPGFLAGVLISVATGFLILMDGTRGDVIRLLVDTTNGRIIDVVVELIKAAMTDGKTFGQGLKIASDIMNAMGARDILATVKTMVIVGVLFSVICAVVSATLEKPGVALELFAYGYTPVALCFAMEGSTVLGAVLAIVVGALLGAIGYRISRGWIIVVPNLIDFLLLLTLLPLFFAGPGTTGNGNSAGGAAGMIGAIGGIGFTILPLLVAIPIGVRRQFKTTAAPKDKAAQPAAPATLKSWWAAKFKAAPMQSTEFVPEEPSAQPGANPTLGRTPPAGGQKFCSKCGKPLEPGAKFCGKCGHPSRSEEDTAKPV